MPVPSTSRPYSLCAGPSAIAQGCLGLGMYFYTIKWLCALALLLSVVYMYPLVDNLGTQGWAARYTLQLGSGVRRHLRCIEEGGGYGGYGGCLGTLYPLK